MIEHAVWLPSSFLLLDVGPKRIFDSFFTSNDEVSPTCIFAGTQKPEINRSLSLLLGSSKEMKCPRDNGQSVCTVGKVMRGEGSQLMDDG